MAKHSAGVLLYRCGAAGAIEVLLGHPGGPLFAAKDLGVWTIPKGEIEPDEAPIEAARREFFEETGMAPPDGDYIDLGTVRQRSGKIVHGFATAGDFDPARLTSTTFAMRWPPRVGDWREYPEIDRAEWFGLDAACAKLNDAQAQLIGVLARALDAEPNARPAS